MKQQKVETKKASRVPIGILIFVLIILIGVVSVQVSNLYLHNQLLEQQAVDLQRAIKAEEKENQALMDYQLYMKTDDYIEQLAKEKLNLIRPDEIKLIPIDE